jgi:hypothetical protein
MNLALERRYGVYRTHLKGLSVSQADDYFQRLLDDETAFDTVDLPANEFCVDDTTVDISFEEYIEVDQTPGDEEPKKAA